MNKPVVILVSMLLALFCLGSRGLAQEQVVHTVHFPQGDAAWSVSFELDDLPGHLPLPKVKTSERQRTKIDVVRKGNLRHDLVTWSDGTTTEYWWSGNPAFVLHQEGNDGRIIVDKTGNMNDSRMDETFFTWISPEHYVGLENFKDKRCRYYEMTFELPSGDKATRRGWIENKTSIPVGWSETGILSIFSFDAPLPSDPLVMPSNFKTALDRMQSFFVFPKRTPASNP